MAIAPLFVADMATLKSRLRLTGVGSSDGLAMIDQAVLDARLGFYRRLTQVRCAVIVAYAHTDTPVTDFETLRVLAESTECKWVRMNLLRTMPTGHVDGTQQIQQWNQEAPFRTSTASDISIEIKRLADDIENNLDLLAVRDVLGAEPTIQSSTIEPDPKCPNPTPKTEIGGSIWPYGHPRNLGKLWP